MVDIFSTVVMNLRNHRAMILAKITCINPNLWNSLLILLLLNVLITYINGSPQLSLAALRTPDQCEPQVLDNIPADPAFDGSFVTIEVARKLSKYLSEKPLASFRELQDLSQTFATEALGMESQVLVVGIAAPSVKIAVMKFRDQLDSSLDQISHANLSSYWKELGQAWNQSEKSQYWGIPFKDCAILRSRWLWPYNMVYRSGAHRIVVSVFIAADNNPCNDDLIQIFGKKHSCNDETTFCLPSFVNDTDSRGTYACICKIGYHIPNQTMHYFESKNMEDGSAENYSCLRCPAECFSCGKNDECDYADTSDSTILVSVLKGTIGTVIGLCIFCCFLLVIIVYRGRKSKAITSGMWMVLEIILFGHILLYCFVALHFLPASTIRCILVQWSRELGFIICYGAIIIKLYGHLIEFRTRKAQPWVLREVDLIKYLAAMIFAVVCYLAAFTASSIDLIESANLEGLQEANANTCQPLKWEYVTQISELFILIFGIHLAIASRNANTKFMDRQYLVVSISIEFVTSFVLYVLRALYLPELNPGTIILALFIRSQLTSTVILSMIFLPKCWYHNNQNLHTDVSNHGGKHAVIFSGDLGISELAISDMSSEEIRTELKRLYTQLEILKNKTLRHDNPHISKRRGGRKVAHRRFSLQARCLKNRSNHNNVNNETTEADASRTPEESICSTTECPTNIYAEM